MCFILKANILDSDRSEINHTLLVCLFVSESWMILNALLQHSVWDFRLHEKTFSLWTHLLENQHQYRNPLYRRTVESTLLRPSTLPLHFKYEYTLKHMNKPPFHLLPTNTDGCKCTTSLSTVLTVNKKIIVV